MFDAYAVNTLQFDEALCTGCGMCLHVCPHGVFERRNGAVRVAAPAAYMECGACQMNCAVGVVQVNSGVGCAGAMIRAALTGRKEVVCGN